MPKSIYRRVDASSAKYLIVLHCNTVLRGLERFLSLLIAWQENEEFFTRFWVLLVLKSRLRLKVSLTLYNLGDTVQQNVMQVTCHKMLTLMFYIHCAVCTCNWFCKAPIGKLLTLLLAAHTFAGQHCQM